MAAPSYTEDLTDINLADGDGDWDESSDVGWDDQGAPAYQDGDYPYIQGSYAVTADCTKTGVGTLLTDYGSGFSMPTDGAFLVWVNFSSPQALATYASGGIRLLTGDTDGDFYAWSVGGSDYGRYPYGGWQNFAANPTVSVDYTAGSPTGTWQIFGAAINVLTGISKGEVFQVDAIRAGRCSSIFEYGDLGNGYCTFAGFAAQNDNSSYRWGLIQAIAGGYLYKGKMTLGTGSNAVDFRDSNVSILIDDTPKVTANFNTIEVNNSSSRVDWTNVKFTALGTVSPGRLVCNTNADLNWDSCQFTGMGAFTFGGTSSTSTNTIWNGCGLVTAAGATLNGSQILGSTVAANASALNWNTATDPDGYLNNMTFTKGTNAHHAIEFGTSAPLTMTLRGMTNSGFNASDAQNDSTFYFADRGSDVTWTVNIVGGTGNFSYKKARAGDTVNIVISPVATQITVKSPADVVVENARVLVEAGDDSGDLPFEDVVTITSSGTTASVAHTGHGMANGDKVAIRGANEQDYNGVYVISNVTTDAYDYTMGGDPASPATGTITATGVVVSGLTNASGIVSNSMAFSVNQNVRGVIRKSSAAPFYKLVDFTDVVDKDSGLTKTVQFVSDE
jgi:hypothetical protein